MTRNTLIPIDKYAHAGYALLSFTGLYWFVKLLVLLGVSSIEEFCLSIPRFTSMTFSVVIPVITLLLGAISYLRHPNEKRKLAYQSLMALSIVSILLFLFGIIDGAVS